MNKIFFLSVFFSLSMLGCSKSDDIEKVESSNAKIEYQKNLQQQVDVAKSGVKIPENMGSPEMALCAASAMKNGQGIGVYKVWVNELNSRYQKNYPEKTKTEIDQYTSERIEDKLNSLKSKGYATQTAFLEFYKVNCQS